MSAETLLVWNYEHLVRAEVDAQTGTVATALSTLGLTGVFISTVVNGISGGLFEAHTVMLSCCGRCMMRRLAAPIRQIACASARPRGIPGWRIWRNWLREDAGAGRSRATPRSPLRVTCSRSASLSGVKIRTIFRHREMLTYHCCAFIDTGGF